MQVLVLELRVNPGPHWAQTLLLEHCKHPGIVVQFKHILPLILTVNPF